MHFENVRNTVVISIRIFVVRDTIAVGIRPRRTVVRVEIDIISKTIAITVIIKGVRNAVTIRIGWR